ncbi:MAG: hypothetical protein ACRDFC_10435 [Ignavibacteria bacterium]
MLEEKDYIMRTIAQAFAKVMAKILFNKEIKNYEQVKFEINNAYKTLLGLDEKLINSLTASELIGLLTLGGKLDYEKSLVLADLLKEDAENEELKNRNLTENTADKYKKSLSLYKEVINNNKSFKTEDILKTIDFIEKKLELFGFD